MAWQVKRVSGDVFFCGVWGMVGDVMIGKRGLRESGVRAMTIEVGEFLIFEVVVGEKGWAATKIEAVSVMGAGHGRIRRRMCGTYAARPASMESMFCLGAKATEFSDGRRLGVCANVFTARVRLSEWRSRRWAER